MCFTNFVQYMLFLWKFQIHCGIKINVISVYKTYLKFWTLYKMPD